LKDAEQTFELPGGWLDVSPDGWLDGKPQQGLGQARERGKGGALGEHADG